MASPRWALCLLVFASIIGPLPAGGSTAVVRDLGTIPAADYDERIVRELFALLKANPTDTVAAVEARVKRESQTTFARFLYDRPKRTLLVLLKTAGDEAGDFYHLRRYPDTEPADFANRLPVRGQKGYPAVSQSFQKTEVTIPLHYPDHPRLSVWP